MSTSSSRAFRRGARGVSVASLLVVATTLVVCVPAAWTENLVRSPNASSVLTPWSRTNIRTVDNLFAGDGGGTAYMQQTILLPAAITAVFTDNVGRVPGRLTASMGGDGGLPVPPPSMIIKAGSAEFRKTATTLHPGLVSEVATVCDVKNLPLAVKVDFGTGDTVRVGSVHFILFLPPPVAVDVNVLDVSGERTSCIWHLSSGVRISGSGASFALTGASETAEQRIGLTRLRTHIAAGNLTAECQFTTLGVGVRLCFYDDAAALVLGSELTLTPGAADTVSVPVTTRADEHNHRVAHATRGDRHRHSHCFTLVDAHTAPKYNQYGHGHHHGDGVESARRHELQRDTQSVIVADSLRELCIVFGQSVRRKRFGVAFHLSLVVSADHVAERLIGAISVIIVIIALCSVLDLTGCVHADRIVFVASVTSTPVIPTPLDEVRPVAVPAEVTQGTATAGTVVVATASSVVGSVGGGAFALQRVSAMAAFCQPFDPDEPRGVLEHPLRFSVGGGRARQAVGAALGAVVLAAVAVAAIAAAAAGHVWYRGRRWGDAAAWRRAAATVRAVPLLAAVFTVAAPMGVDAAVEAAVQGATGLEHAVGWVVLLLCLAPPAVVLALLWRPVRSRCHFVPAGAARSRDQSLLPHRGPSVRVHAKTLWQWLWRESGEWREGAAPPTVPGPARPGLLDDDELMELFGVERDQGARMLDPSAAPAAADAAVPSPLPVFGGLFMAYRAPWHWFLAAEAYAALAIAGISAASSAPAAWACVAAEAGAVAVAALLLAVTAVLRPYLAPGDAAMAVAASVLEVVAAVLRVAGVGDAAVAGLLLALAGVAIVQLVASVGRRLWGVVRRKVTKREAGEGRAPPEAEELMLEFSPEGLRTPVSVVDPLADFVYDPPEVPDAAKRSPFEFEVEAASEPSHISTTSFVDNLPIPCGEPELNIEELMQGVLAPDASTLEEEPQRKVRGPTTEDDHLAKRAELQRLLAKDALL